MRRSVAVAATIAAFFLGAVTGAPLVSPAFAQLPSPAPPRPAGLQLAPAQPRVVPVAAQAGALSPQAPRPAAARPASARQGNLWVGAPALPHPSGAVQALFVNPSNGKVIYCVSSEDNTVACGPATVLR